MNKEKFQEIGLLLLKGLNEKKACILSDVDYLEYIQAKENDPVIRIYVEKKIAKFELNHLEVIQKTKSDKNSMYLLEKLRPDDFGTKARNQGPVINIISAILKEVQNDNTINPIVTYNRENTREIQGHTVPQLGGTDLLG